MENNEINQKKQEQVKKVLEGYCKDWKIFIDTCSLLYFSSDDFWMNIIPLLHRYQNKIIVPLRCVEEIEKHSKNKGDSETAQKAKSCLKQLNQLMEAGYVEIRGEKTDNFADNVFQVVFTKFRMEYKLLTDSLCKELQGRITFFLTRYHEVHNSYGRASIRLDGRELTSFS